MRVGKQEFSQNDIAFVQHQLSQYLVVTSSNVAGWFFNVTSHRISWYCAQEAANRFMQIQRKSGKVTFKNKQWLVNRSSKLPIDM